MFFALFYAALQDLRELKVNDYVTYTFLSAGFGFALARVPFPTLALIICLALGAWVFVTRLFKEVGEADVLLLIAMAFWLADAVYYLAFLEFALIIYVVYYALVPKPWCKAFVPSLFLSFCCTVLPQVIVYGT